MALLHLEMLTLKFRLKFHGKLFSESSSSFLKDERGEVYNLFESVLENFNSICSVVL